ncbi:LOW QUALITY PROTEIN: F-box protein At1g20360 [Capsella rubella]|uniref:LOW QUALITY PROTEIN: F-box protein At1g20360 n=1 Tax=Capsella rubella TaxID=81985 RepID=UPI000CD5205E|nr:LOW QUALITY PROTEIN: F-box protein At1g20360 [Capsella rubella]
MDDLPLYLLDEILFRLELKSLAIMRCTNKYFQSYLSDDSDFEIAYFSMFKIKPSLFHLYNDGAIAVFCQPLVSSCDSRSFGKIAYLNYRYPCYIFGSCSGLLLLYINGLFVANPVTKTFQILNHSGSNLIPMIVGGNDMIKMDDVARTERAMCVGFAVNRNRTTKSFKIVCILEMETVYGFEISDGCSWRLSETTITAGSKSVLMMRMKHVYLDDTLYWLRNDGSIIAFNPETEQAQLISSIFHLESDMKLLFGADDKINRLTLISGTKEMISVYILMENSKWTLSRRFKLVSMKNKMLLAGTWLRTTASVLW